MHGVMEPENVFRDANDRIAEKAVQLDWREPVPFLCECSDRRCFARLRVTLEQYESLRAHQGRYLIKPGHKVSGGFVIEQDERLAVIEKLYAER
jgi:hypothetical protein